MDDEGYPDDGDLDRVRQWPYQDGHGLMAWIRPHWAYANSGYWEQEGDTYRISTAGWSGNEDFIGAMQANAMWWFLHWYSSRRGGHYVFVIRHLSDKDPEDGS